MSLSPLHSEKLWPDLKFSEMALPQAALHVCATGSQLVCGKLEAGSRTAFPSPAPAAQDGANHLSYLVQGRCATPSLCPPPPTMAPRALFVFAPGAQVCPLTSDLALCVPTTLGLSSWLQSERKLFKSCFHTRGVSENGWCSHVADESFRP